MEALKMIQGKLGIIPFDGVIITIAAYMLAPSEDKVKNAVIIAGLHGLLHGAVCKIQAEDGFVY